MIVTLLIPPVAIVLGALVLDERLGPNALAGFALLAVGLIVMNGASSTSPSARNACASRSVQRTVRRVSSPPLSSASTTPRSNSQARRRPSAWGSVSVVRWRGSDTCSAMAARNGASPSPVMAEIA
jgi:hypothetical protein